MPGPRPAPACANSARPVPFPRSQDGKAEAGAARLHGVDRAGSAPARARCAADGGAFEPSQHSP
eukprot:6611820-Prymnesium_polylepis.1